jgi:hypothetical protein
MNTRITDYERVTWRQLCTGCEVWAPFGGDNRMVSGAWPYGWREATVMHLGKNRGDQTIVTLIFERGKTGQRLAGELFWRRAKHAGNDKPPITIRERA